METKVKRLRVGEAKPSSDEHDRKIMKLMGAWTIIEDLSKKSPFENLCYYTKAYYFIRGLVEMLENMPDFPPRKMRNIGKCLCDLEKDGWLKAKDVHEVFGDIAERIAIVSQLPFVRAWAKPHIKKPRTGDNKAKSSAAYKKFHLDFFIFMITRDIKKYYASWKDKKGFRQQDIFRNVAKFLKQIDPRVIVNSSSPENVIKQRYDNLTEQEVMNKFLLFSTLPNGFSVNALTEWPDKPTGYLKTFLEKVKKYDKLNQESSHAGQNSPQK